MNEDKFEGEEEIVDILWQGETEEPDTPSEFRTFGKTNPTDPQGTTEPPPPTAGGQLTLYEPPPPPRTAVELLRRQYNASRECNTISRRMGRSYTFESVPVEKDLFPLPPRSMVNASRATTSMSTNVAGGSGGPYGLGVTREPSSTLLVRVRAMAEEVRAERVASRFMVERVVVGRLKTQSIINPLRPPSKVIHRLMDEKIIAPKDHASIVRPITRGESPKNTNGMGGGGPNGAGTRALQTSQQTLRPAAGVVTTQSTQDSWGFGASGAYDGLLSRSDVLQLQGVFNPQYCVVKAPPRGVVHESSAPLPVRVDRLIGVRTSTKQKLPTLTVSRNVSRSVYSK